MTTTESAMATRADSSVSGPRTLEPFVGEFIPGVCFASGHCIWLLAFTATPTRFDSYTELWVVTPDGERSLYTDPGPAAEEVLQYHEFDRTEGATITHDITGDQLSVQLDGDDGTTLEVDATVEQTFATRVLNTVISFTPDSVLRSSLGTTVSTASLNLLLDANGLQIAGRTETDRRYRLDADRLHQITAASATLDGRELGPLRAPQRPIEFGDAKTTGDALYVPGTLHLERVGQNDA